MVVFQRGQADEAVIKPGGKTLSVTVGDGLPKTSSMWEAWMKSVFNICTLSFTTLFVFLQSQPGKACHRVVEEEASHSTEVGRLVTNKSM